MNANDNNNNDNEQQHDNSATLPRSNISSPQHSAKQPNQQQSALSQNTNTNNNSIVGGEGKAPAVVELSSLFQTESTLFRDESQHSSGKCYPYALCIICSVHVICGPQCVHI